MTIKAQLDQEMKAAAKAREKLRLSTIRLMRNAVGNAEIDQGKELEDAQVVEILSKLAKQYQDSIEAYQKGNRPDLVEKEQTELKVLQEFLPKQLSPGEIAEMVKGAVERFGAKGTNDMGMIMKELKIEYAGRASGKDVSEEVKRQLAQLSE